MTNNLIYHYTDNGFCRAYYLSEKGIYALQKDIGSHYSLFVCTSEGEPSHEVDINNFNIPEPPKVNCKTDEEIIKFLTSNIKFIKNDEDVGEINQQQLSVIKSFIDKYHYTKKAYIFETIHGFSAIIRSSNYADNEFSRRPKRMNKDDINFLNKMKDQVRWIELRTQEIDIGL